MTRASNSSSWRHLNLEDMAQWPDAPRRSLLAILAVFVGLLTVLYVLMPLYFEWQKEQSDTHVLQQRYVEALKQSKQPKSAQMGAIEAVVSKPELSAWMADLAVSAEQKGLQAIHITPVGQNAAQAKEQTIGTMQIRVEGDFLAVLQWWQMLSTSPKVLSMEQIELTGVGENRVRAQLNVLFEQKGGV